MLGSKEKKVMDLVLKIRPGPSLVLTNGDQNWQLTDHDEPLVLLNFISKTFLPKISVSIGVPHSGSTSKQKWEPGSMSSSS